MEYVGESPWPSQPDHPIENDHRNPHGRSLTHSFADSIRRVRCDRTRPHCERCTKTGRKCDGYPVGVAAQQNQESSTISSSEAVTLAPRISRSHSILNIDAHLHRSLHYYQHRTALEFSGYFHNDLWNTLVLQISHRESCVKHLIVALGLLHESFHQDSVRLIDPASDQKLRRQALSQYSTGVSLLNQHISSRGWAELEVTLLCSILCVTFEWLRGDYPTANAHLRSSLSIMSQWHAKDSFVANSTSLWSPSGHMIRNKLRPLCTSLVLQARTMPMQPPLPVELPNGIEDQITPFATLQEARESLDIILAYALPETIARKVGSPIEETKHWELSLRLARWSQYFDDYLSVHNPGNENIQQVAIMKLWYNTSRILFTASLLQDEGDFDRFLSEFQRIVDSVEVLLSSAPSYFSVDIGVVPLLYYVALKCRHPIIRRRAINMLESAPRREAVWDSAGAANVTREVMNVEEAGLGSLYRDSDIPRSARVCSMDLEPDVEHRRVRLRTKRQGDSAWSCEKVLVW